MRENNKKETWAQTKELLESSLPSHAFNTWIKPLHYHSADSDKIVLEVPNTYYKDRISQSYAKTIRAKFRQLTQSNDLDVSFVTASSPNIHKGLLDEISKTRQENIQKQQKKIFSNLNDRYSFSSYVVGHSNQFAHAAALAVVDQPGRTYNPLLFYGGVGLGKTHLLCAIGNTVVQNNPNKKVLYRTSEQFMNELINAIRYQRTGEFRNQYRHGCDLLLIDDIQFFGGKERTQEEFFHTFNALHQMNIQMVMTSDRMPNEIPDLDQRLRSRFDWGLLCDIQKPDIETRVAILQKKANGHHMDLNDDVSYFIAEKFSSSVRALEGALIRLSAYASLSKHAIDLAFAKDIFLKLGEEVKIIEIPSIQKSVAKAYQVTVSDITSSRRHKVVAFPRQVAMYLSRDITQKSYPEIGHQFGGKDHSTVMHACDKIEKLRKTDSKLDIQLRSLKKQIENSL